VLISRRRRRVCPRTARRRGAAVTELAVCLPMLTLVVFGSIQACNLIYLKHGCITAAYEATLELAKPNATNSSITSRAQQVLTARGIGSSQIHLLPLGTEAANVAAGTLFTIEVTAEVQPNMSLSGFFPVPANVTGRITATR
jgi:Flp pilus assembly protein TadG